MEKGEVKGIKIEVIPEGEGSARVVGIEITDSKGKTHAFRDSDY